MSLPPNWRSNLILERCRLGLGKIFLALDAIQTDGEVKGWKRIKYAMGSGVACSWESIWIFVSGIFHRGWKLYSVQSELSLRYNTTLGFVLGPPAHIQVYWQELLQERKLHARDAWSWMQDACATLLVGTWPFFQSCQLMESCSLVWPESGCVL